MSNREFTATRTMLANAMATAGAELLDYMGTAAALAAIPNTDPPRYVVAGTLAMIAKVLPNADAPAAATVLTDDQIMDMAEQFHDVGGVQFDEVAFARYLLAHAGVTAEPVDQGHVLRTLRRMLDGSQPKDISGALMVIDSALKSGVAWSYDIAPPQGFINYVKANYDGDVHFHDPEWHATRLWNAAMKNVGARIPAQAPAAEVRAQALEEAAKVADGFCDLIRQYTTDVPAIGYAILSLAKQSPADKASEVRAADPKQLKKWWSMRGAVVTAAINGHAVYLPPGDADELLNVFDAALPDELSTADSANTGALGEGAEA